MTDICEKILTTLQGAFGGAFRQYYDGDPVSLPEQCLPCLIVDLNDTHVTQGPTGFDRLTHTITVKVALNKKDDYGKSAVQATTTKKLRSYSQGQADAGGFLPQSILGVLRTDDTLRGRIVNQDEQVRYGVVDRFESNSVTAEAHVVVTATELVPARRLYPDGGQ